MLKKTHGANPELVSIAGFVTIFAFALSGIAEIITFTSALIAERGLGESFSVLMKALAVMFVTEISADICERAGEGILSKALSVAGRVEILIIGLPLFKSLIDTACSFTY